MTTSQFFRFSLLLPIIVGGVAAALAPKSLPVAALVYGGIPYLVIAAIVYIPIGRAKSLARLVSISIAMPLALMLLLAPLGLLMAAIGFFVGIAYATLAWMLYGVGRKTGLVLAMPPNTSLEHSRDP